MVSRNNNEIDRKVSVSTDNESECDENGVTCDKALVTKRRHIHHDEDRSSCYSDEDFHFSDEEQVEEEEEEDDDEDEGEEEELSEYWDQVSFNFRYFLSLLISRKILKIQSNPS